MRQDVRYPNRHHVDLEVGRRIRERREALGRTQSDLAKGLGITFQQVQKYENAVNRVSASRLADAAAYLEIGVSYFFGPYSNETA